MAAIMDTVRAQLPLVTAQPLWVQAALGLSAVALAVVALHIVAQLVLPQSKSNPPVVFHSLPVVGSAISYGMDPYRFFFECRKKYGDVFTFVLFGRRVTVALGPKGSNLVFNGRLNQVSAEEAYTSLTTPVFGHSVVYDVPNSVFMEQKRFVKVGLSIENFRHYVDLIVKELDDYLATDPSFAPLRGSPKPGASATVNIFPVSYTHLRAHET